MILARVCTRSAAMGIALMLCLTSVIQAQEVGGIRGVVYDKDFDVPLVGAQVLLYETGEKTTTSDEGHFVFGQVPPGTYTLVFSKEGYTRQFMPDIVVSRGSMIDVDTSLAGEFTEMEEFVVQDLDLTGSSEIGVLKIRMESPSLMDSISSELISRAGASDAASALTLVSGATVEEGKYAVVRGLPDRYVNSQLNGVRLPTADADKRAVQLDQFPAALIESLQVSKTFTPNQQGDASGGAVNLILKGIPEERVLSFKVGTEYNTQVANGKDFLSYKGGGVNLWGIDDGGRDIGGFGGTMGVSRDNAPTNYNWSLTTGGKHVFENDILVGGLVSMYYKRDPSYYEDGQEDIYEALLDNGSYGLVPYVREDFTSLFDVTQGVDKVQWGFLGMVGAEFENHSLSLLFMHTQVTEDKATLMEDTRGKAYFADNDDVNADWHRSQTLEYTERSQSTVQLKGQHTIEIPERELGRFGKFLNPEIDWTLASSVAVMDQPDKRVFSTWWQPERQFGAHVFPAQYNGYDPSGSGHGFAQRIWKDITEESGQFLLNAKLPFEQWTGDEGYLKVGLFGDVVNREYNQSSFSYDSGGSYEAPWDRYWSDVYVSEGHEISPSDEDVDYEGEQIISAFYYMVDLPLSSYLNIIGGIRYESTELNITNHPKTDSAQYLPPDGTGWTKFGPEADVTYLQDDTLPSLGVEFSPIEEVKIRASYSETVARQTFKELSPVMQMEYLGAGIFVGNPGLRMSALDNYDIRFDYEPYPGGLFSASWFRKDIIDPIEYVQRFQASLYYVTPVNYPEGWLEGFELEVRQSLDKLWSPLEGFSVGANATFIDSEVTLPADEAADFARVGAPTSTRHMMGAPEHLYNFNLTYESEKYGTQIGLFYTVRGDTLVEGGVALGNGYVPDVYAKEYDTLNIGITQPIGEHWKIAFRAKNLTNPEIEEVYRSDYIAGETVKKSYRKGIDYSIGLSAEYKF